MLGFFFLPNHWVELVSNETTQRNNPATELQSDSGHFASSTGEIGSLFQQNKGLFTFYLIYKVFTVL